jgi:soluble cytochrome b562
MENTGTTEPIIEMKQLTETMEKLQQNMEWLEMITATVFQRMNAKVNEITNALNTLQSQVVPKNQQVKNVNPDFQNVMYCMNF